MKRSLLPQVNRSSCTSSNTFPVDEESRENQESQSKRIKRSTSSSGVAAMTLLSLALSASTRKVESSSTPRTPSRILGSADRDLDSVPCLVVCDNEDGDDTNTAKRETIMPSLTRAMPAPSMRLAPLSTPYTNIDLKLNCCTPLRGNWRTAFKPLPLPPRLPRGLPAGARAGISR